MRLVLLPRAEEDAQEIVRYLTEHESSTRVSKVLQSINDSVESIRLNPELAPLEFKSKNIRKKVINYRISIYYVILDSTIQILRIWHNARDPQDLTLETEE